MFSMPTVCWLGRDKLFELPWPAWHCRTQYPERAARKELGLFGVDGKKLGFLGGMLEFRAEFFNVLNHTNFSGDQVHFRPRRCYFPIACSSLRMKPSPLVSHRQFLSFRTRHQQPEDSHARQGRPSRGVQRRERRRHRSGHGDRRRGPPLALFNQPRHGLLAVAVAVVVYSAPLSLLAACSTRAATALGCEK
jgi:hypothetical protein